MGCGVFIVLAGALAVSPSIATAENHQPPDVAVAFTPAESDAVRARLFAGVSGQADFEADLALGADLGVGSQVLLEAKIARYWRLMDIPRLIPIADEMKRRLDDWDIDDSEVFRSQGDVHGFYNLFRALEAKEAQNLAGFEHFAKESFWHHPELGAMLSRLIIDTRKSEAEKTLVVPMETEIATAAGDMVTLGQLVAGQKAIMLEFWATWCAPCMVLLPELEEKAKKLGPKGVVVAGVNTESVQLAAAVAEERGIDFSWLVEPLGGPISRILMIDSIPRVVLLSPGGKVLYSGHPMDPALEEVIASLD